MVLVNTLALRKIVLICLVIFCFSGCQRSQQKSNIAIPLSLEERVLLEEFFLCLLVQHAGAYTLFGSKPITICGTFDCQQRNDVWDPDELQEGLMHLKTLPVDVARRQLLCSHEPMIRPEHMHIWDRVKEQISMSNYQVFYVPRRVSHKEQQNSDATYVALINKQQTAYILQKYYPIFAEQMGYEFSIEEVVQDIENLQGVFWQKIFCSDSIITQGLLYGFGLQNSEVYALAMNQNRPDDREFFDNVIFHPTENTSVSRVFGMEDLRIPRFRCADATYEKYEREKQVIQKLYEGGDFLTITLQRLMSPTPDPSVIVSRH